MIDTARLATSVLLLEAAGRSRVLRAMILMTHGYDIDCTASTAQVPVPHGDRSSAPVHVDGRFQSSRPVETITAFRQSLSGEAGGPDSCAIVGPVMAAFSG